MYMDSNVGTSAGQHPPRQRVGYEMWLPVALAVSLFCGIGISFAQPGDGPPDIQETPESPDALAVAASVQTFYEQTTGVAARFRQSYYYKLYDRYDRSQGRVTFLKPGMMQFRYARPNGKTITSNGEKLWVFEPGGENESAQCIEQNISEHQLPRAFSFLTGEGELAEDFNFRLLDSERHRYEDGYVLELRPKEDSPHYDRILFYIPRQEGRPSGIVRRVLIVDPSGNRNRFDFSSMEWNPEITAEAFDYSPPRGVSCAQP